MRYTIISLCSIFVIIGCRSEYKEIDVLSLYDNDKHRSISDNIADIDFIALQNDDANIIGNVDKVIMDDSYVYVGDYKSRKICIYEHDGSFVGSINRYGRGPGEYNEIREFSVNDSYVYILDNFTDKLIVYNKTDFTYDTEFKLPFNAWDFEVLNNGEFIFAYAPMHGHNHVASQLRYRLIVTDSQLQIKERLLGYKNKESDVFAFKNYLTSYNDIIIYSSFAEDAYSLISKNNGEMMRTVNIQLPNQIPLTERSNIQYVTDGVYSYQYETPIMCGDYIAFRFAIDGEGYDYFLDDSNNVFMTNSDKDVKNIFGVVGSCDDCYISYWGSSEIYEMLISNGFPQASTTTEELILNDYPYLVLYHMR